jgi:hypothetical protein
MPPELTEGIFEFFGIPELIQMDRLKRQFRAYSPIHVLSKDKQLEVQNDGFLPFGTVGNASERALCQQRLPGIAAARIPVEYLLGF